MKKKLHQDNRGVAHLALIAVIVVVVAAVGFAAYRVMNKDKDDNKQSNNSSQQQSTEDACKSNDKDLCKFFKSYKSLDNYKMDITMTQEGQKSTMAMEVDDEKVHMTISAEGVSYETITIGNAYYTKATNGTWWKQTLKAGDENLAEDLTLDSDDPEASNYSYKKLGTEACGSLTCQKYEVKDSKNPKETQVFYFDTKDYKLRRIDMTDSDGNKGTLLVSYSDVSVKEPSPVKELGPNQYLVPGQAEPMTMPTAP